MCFATFLFEFLSGLIDTVVARWSETTFVRAQIAPGHFVGLGARAAEHQPAVGTAKTPRRQAGVVEAAAYADGSVRGVLKADLPGEGEVAPDLDMA